MHPVRCSCTTWHLMSPCQGLLLVDDSLSHTTREESVEEHPWGSSTQKASLGKQGENGSCVVEKSHLLCLTLGKRGTFEGGVWSDSWGCRKLVLRSVVSLQDCCGEVGWWNSALQRENGESGVSSSGPGDVLVFGKQMVVLGYGRGQPLHHCVLGRERNLGGNHTGPRFSALCCEPAGGKALCGSYCLSSHGSVMISSLFLILFYVFNNDVFAVNV